MSDKELVHHTGVACPKCGCEVVHNGNFFCSDWPRCEWALGRTKKDESMRKKLGAQ